LVIVEDGMSDPKWVKPGLDHATGRMVEEAAELSVELGRLAQILGKALRFGWLSYDPRRDGRPILTNAAAAKQAMMRVRAELTDVMGAMTALEGELEKIAGRGPGEQE
jgi:hypothetical protein